MSAIYEITTLDQMNDLLRNYQVVIVDIWASWCGPCKMLAPKYEALANKYSSQSVIFCKNDASTGLFQVSGLPNIDFWVNGQKYHTVLGADIKAIEDTLQRIGVPAKQISVPAVTTTAGTPQSGRRGRDKLYKSYGDY